MKRQGRFSALFFAGAMALPACATHGARAAKHGTMPPAAHDEDFTLGDGRAGDDDEMTATFFTTSSDKGTGVAPVLPGVTSTLASSEDEPDEMFSGDAPSELKSSISQVIDELVPIHIYVVTADAAVRAHPIGDAHVVKTLPRGRRLVGLPQGDWICIGKGQFVEAAALAPFTEESDTAAR